MKKLTLLRHAKSDWHAAANDYERPLNKRGRKSAVLIGQRLAKRDYHPEKLISSPAERAKQTAIKIAEQIDYPATEIEFQAEIYEAGLQTLIELVRQLDDDSDDVMLVGHNPGFSALGQWLSNEAPDWLPTCGLLRFELPIHSWAQSEENCAVLRWYDYPKKMSD